MVVKKTLITPKITNLYMETHLKIIVFPFRVKEVFILSEVAFRLYRIEDGYKVNGLSIW